MALLVDNPESNKHTRILRLPEVMDRTGESRSTIYRLDKKGILRRAKNLDGSTSAGWHEDSVDAYVESRRADPINPPESIDSGQARASKTPALVRRACDIGDKKSFGPIPVGRSKISSAWAGEVSSEMHATGMIIMGNKVYFHAPTGKLYMELGKAPAFFRGIGVAVDEGTMDDAEHPSAASELAISKRRAASL
jgi:predicted DNA-binding transcriptional regulator AlpA